MKIVFITRSTLYTVKGGDSMQIMETAKQLNQLGVETDIKLTDEKIDYEKYDLLHFFNITRPADILYHLKKTCKPFVLSPILIDYSEYDKQYRKGFSGILLRYFSRDNIEYLKTAGRSLKGTDKLMAKSYLWKGQKKSIKKILNNASLLFPNSEMEREKLKKYYQSSAAFVTVHNGINPALFTLNKSVKKDTQLVLCVARIEGIKNQINLIKALNNSIYRLLIIGSPAPNQISYYKKCREAAASNVVFIEHLNQEELVQFYQMAAVHVLPSWFETCGLSSLEAAVMGCNIVVTDKGYTHEYYNEHAFYCDPGSPVSILKAVDNAAKAAFPKALREKILSCYTWLQAATVTAKAYHKILAHP
jgi:glycosyltransferase involved in cell wall biosynthesis